jgi:hypothetical protein
MPVGNRPLDNDELVKKSKRDQMQGEADAHSRNGG